MEDVLEMKCSMRLTDHITVSERDVVVRAI